jgi:hypothetical protein
MIFPLGKEGLPVMIKVEEHKPHEPNIKVHCITDNIEINFNSHKLFNTLANKDRILSAMNKKLNELLQKHLDKRAAEEAHLLGVKTDEIKGEKQDKDKDGFTIK